MRGADTFTESLFTLRKLEDFVPARHPLRAIRKMANPALGKLAPVVTAMYAADLLGGRPSIAPEKLLHAMLLQVLFSVRSERQLTEQVHYNLLFRWFIGLSMDDAVWGPRCSPRTANARLSTTRSSSSSTRWWPSRSSAICSRASTSAWTAR